MESLTAVVPNMDHWLSVKEYASQAGIQTRSVHIRSRRGVISSVLIDDILVIDAELSPPMRTLPHKAPRAPRFVWPPTMPPLANMVRMTMFCERNHIRGHELYRDILLGEIRAWHFAEHIFIENSPSLQVYLSNGRRPKWSPRM